MKKCGLGDFLSAVGNAKSWFSDNRGFVQFQRFFGSQLFSLIDIELKVGYIMYFMPTNHIKKVPCKNIEICPFRGQFRSNSALATDFPRYVQSRHGFILSQMAIKIYRVTQETKGFQLIPHKPGLDEKKFHRARGAPIPSGRGSEPDEHGCPETCSKGFCTILFFQVFER